MANYKTKGRFSSFNQKVNTTCTQLQSLNLQQLYWSPYFSKVMLFQNQKMQKHNISARLLTTERALHQRSFCQEYPNESAKISSNTKTQAHCLPKPDQRSRLDVSFVCQAPAKSFSPARSNMSSRQEEYYRQIQWSLLNENRNLQGHIEFLSTQVKTMFQREKKQFQINKALKAKCRQIQIVNVQLHEQLYRLINQTLAQIQKIQNLLKKQGADCDQLLLSSVRKSEWLGSQTELTINNNLQGLKSQISSVITAFSPNNNKFKSPSVQSQVQSQNKSLVQSEFTITKLPTIEIETNQSNYEHKQEQENSAQSNLAAKNGLKRYLKFTKK